MIKKLFVFSTLAVAVFCTTTAASAQRRDSLTEAEIELVRDAQAIDARIEIFVKAVDRRLAVLNIQTNQTNQTRADDDKKSKVDDKKSKKEAENWGEPPTGTRLELLTDIKKILASAIDNIDDAAAHAENGAPRGSSGDAKKDAKMFPKAVRKLVEASNRFLPELKAELDKSTDEREKGLILSAIESCEQIIEASGKVPKEEPKESKKKSGG